MSIDAKTFVPLLGGVLSDLPNVCFRKDIVGFTESVNGLGEAIELRFNQSKLTPQERAQDITQQVADTLDSLRSCPDHAPYFQVLDNLSNSLGNNVQSVFNTLRYTIKPEVDGLYENIQSETSRILNSQTATTLTPNQEIVPANVALDDINWENRLPDRLSPETIIDVINTMCTNPVTPSIAAISVFLNENNIPEIEPLKFDEEVVADIIARWSEEVGDSTAHNLWVTLSDPYEYDRVILPLRNAKDTNNYGLLVEQLLSLCHDTNALSIIRKVPVNISAEMSNILTDNFEKLQSARVIAGFFLLCLRANYDQNNAVIINEHYYDSTKLTDGLTVADLTKHLQVVYLTNDRVVPSSGVSVSEILQTRDQINVKLEEQHAQNTLQLNTSKLHALVEAAKGVLNNYLASTDPSRLPGTMTVAEFIDDKRYLVSALVNKVNSSEDNNIESLLYDFVIATHYPDTIIATAHRLMGIELIKLMKANPEVQDADLKIIDITVAARIIASFLFKELCCTDKSV